jgi:hypothetical protein
MVQLRPYYSGFRVFYIGHEGSPYRKRTRAKSHILKMAVCGFYTAPAWICQTDGLPMYRDGSASY